MKNKSKFIWFYSVLLFSASILLILISSLSQSRLLPSNSLSQQDEQQAFNQTIQRSLTDLVSENESLRKQIAEANEKIDKLSGEATSLTAEAKEKNLASEAAEFLMESEMLFNTGKYAASRDTLQNVNALILSDNGKQLYDWLKGKLVKKGYKFEG